MNRMPTAPARRKSKVRTPEVSVDPIHDVEQAHAALTAGSARRFSEIQRRAYDHFERRGGVWGNDWEDWLRAERELFWMPRAEMFENPFTIVVRVAVPGFDARSIAVIAAPHSILVQAAEKHHHYGLDARVRFCEFGRELFRRFDLPARIDPKSASASLDKGILEIVAEIVRKVR
jgi:HSP20 family molecular chaperone IbpA